MKFATKLIGHYPPHLRHVATLPSEIKKIKFSADVKENAKIAFLSPICYSSTNFDIFGV